jgi:hypothetical protein
MPDFLQDLRNIGLTPPCSAEDYTKMWKNSVKASGTAL